MSNTVDILEKGLADGSVIKTDMARKLTIGGITKTFPVCMTRKRRRLRHGTGERIMTKREQMVECAEQMENGMIHTTVHRDMWQNDLIWWMCKAIKLLLDDRMSK